MGPILEDLKTIARHCIVVAAVLAADYLLQHMLPPVNQPDPGNAAYFARLVMRWFVICTILIATVSAILLLVITAYDAVASSVHRASVQRRLQKSEEQ